jgi:hypothetical protein
MVQMKQQELQDGEMAAVMKLCNISALRILARRLAPDAAAAEADTWRADSSAEADAAPGGALGGSAAGPAAAASAALKKASSGAPFPLEWQPAPPPRPPSEPDQPPAPLLQDLNPLKVLVRGSSHSCSMHGSSTPAMKCPADKTASGAPPSSSRDLPVTFLVPTQLHTAQESTIALRDSILDWAAGAFDTRKGFQVICAR